MRVKEPVHWTGFVQDPHALYRRLRRRHIGEMWVGPRLLITDTEARHYSTIPDWVKTRHVR